MKVLIKAVITLSLAVPLNLVSADELVIKVQTHNLGKIGDNTSRDIKDVITINPMSYQDVIVQTPRLDPSHVVKMNIVKTRLKLKQADLPGSAELASIDNKKIRDTEIQ